MNLYQYADFLKDWHLGASNAVKGSELARAFGVSNRKLHEAVNTLRRDGIPIASNSDGYFYAETARGETGHAQPHEAPHSRYHRRHSWPRAESRPVYARIAGRR